MFVEIVLQQKVLSLQITKSGFV